MEKLEIIIDAKDKALGRVASETAKNLMAKTTAAYSPGIKPKIRVKVINLSKLRITSKKLEQKTYPKYSGHPGGLKYVSMKKFIEKGYTVIFKHAVLGMLPKNRLRKEILKNLIIEA
ncbi:MAG: 50S ribosomal protein L13 [Candidatus Tagabacteria bacterium CG_4_10_14_0_2_um_filter_40_13]|uniref:50S ribosomal protein L13 n=2 Tax=Candidatus Tagaibacteriota TaxID=1817918 RepID=A0A2M7B9R8_9BACT|nr:MAG: 50S ribosomal protein L13 [Candidatus Tagabacteria bacterium CG11_big_fil_rev_8_21_14_0_20_41_11]PIU99852.1 MAG: 50S ribosomal protein L13 [Candidatus Tagabacteria bacterium CG03_land_8_20_14_0_80_41_22]PIZ56066.1 MAG: 50S ribosomal protein L13 [Candidatus Tagabacteria bacterium CG_4_10_14_0_2_um_filter_40_13]PJC25206.1 MAG: 50S ribosomal protein L13 [Candidatus Tagabacteria bacterium CG_4_9_14_0_2_um_filter_41_11]